MTERSLRDAMLLHVAQAARLDGDGVDGRSGLPEDLRERLSADETALAEWRGLVRQARALVSLGARSSGTHQAPGLRSSRLRAPADLDGRVVAALQAGRREERAVTALRSLARVDVPSELTARVRRLAERSFSDDPEHRAPRVLDRLVEEEIADHPASVTKRMVGGLTRHVAPSSLEDGLQAGFLQTVLSGPRGEGSRLLDSRKARRLSRLMPAALVMALVGLGWNAYQGLDSGAIAAERWSFEIIEVDAASAPDLASLLDAFTGGGGSR